MTKRKMIKGQTTHTTTSKDWTTRALQKNGNYLMCSGRVRSSCSTGGPCRVTLNYKPDCKSWMGKGPDNDNDKPNTVYPWSFVTHIIRNVNQVMHGGDSKNFRIDEFTLTTRNPWFSSFLVSSNLLSRTFW